MSDTSIDPSRNAVCPAAIPFDTCMSVTSHVLIFTELSDETNERAGRCTQATDALRDLDFLSLTYQAIQAAGLLPAFNERGPEVTLLVPTNQVVGDRADFRHLSWLICFCCHSLAACEQYYCECLYAATIHTILRMPFQLMLCLVVQTLENSEPCVGSGG